MDTILFKLFTVVCLLCVHTFATETSDTKKSGPPSAGGAIKTIGDVLQDLQAAAGEHYGGGGGGGEGSEGHEMGDSNKGIKGGFDKGSKKYSGNEYNKKGGDWGKTGHKKYDSGDKWGTNKWDKKSMNQFGDKWGENSGKKNAGNWEEWADNSKWKTDKGKV